VRDLVFTFLPPKSIARALGTPDSAYFCRLSHCETCMTPSEYVKAERTALKL